jgi:hypothetical protein
MLDEHWDQDEKGDSGTRLWLPKDFKQFDRGLYQDSGVKERSDVLKDPTSQDLDALRRHVHDKAEVLTHGGQFFKGGSGVDLTEPGAARAGSKRGLDACDGGEGQGDQADEEEATYEPPVKKLKGNITKLRLGAYEIAQKGVDKLIEAANANGVAMRIALGNAVAAPTPPETTDIRARAVYVKDCRKHCCLLGLWTMSGLDASRADVSKEVDSAPLAWVTLTSEIVKARTLAITTGDAELNTEWRASDSNAFRGAANNVGVDDFKTNGKDQIAVWTTFFSLPSIFHLKEEMIHTEADHMELAVLKQQWMRAWAWGSHVGTKCKQVAKSLEDHIKAVADNKLKAAEKKRAEEEKLALKCAKDEAKKKATAIKKTQSVGLATLPPVVAYLKDYINKDGDVRMYDMPTKKSEELHIKDFDAPFVIPDGPAMAEWSSSALAQGTMAKWAGAYKKDPDFIAKNTKSDPLDQISGLALAENMFGAMLKPVAGNLLALTEISKTWNSTSWKFGNSTDLYTIGMAPNSSALLKYQVMGDTQYYAFDLSLLSASLVKTDGFCMKALKQMIAETCAATPDEYNLFLNGLGVIVYRGYVAQGNAIYVPAGYAIIECVSKGPLNFGLRKSFFLNMPKAKKSYAAAIALLKADGANVERMESILTRFV